MAMNVPCGQHSYQSQQWVVAVHIYVYFKVVRKKEKKAGKLPLIAKSKNS